MGSFKGPVESDVNQKVEGPTSTGPSVKVDTTWGNKTYHFTEDSTTITQTYTTHTGSTGEKLIEKKAGGVPWAKPLLHKIISRIGKIKRQICGAEG